MPEEISFKTDIGSSTKVLIIDEIGGIVSSLADSLLERRFDVCYFGIETKETFDYLFGKDSFTYLNSLDEEGISEVSYIYYFPKNNLENIRPVFSLLKRNYCRLLICANIEFPEIRTLEELSDSKEINFRLVLFDKLYGQRVEKEELSKYFISGVRSEKLQIDQKQEDVFSPIYGKSLLEEILRLSFYPNSRGKIYFVKSEEVTYQSFFSILKKVFPEADFFIRETIDFSSDSKRITLPGKTKTVLVNDNLEDKLSDTAEWFTRKYLKTTPEDTQDSQVDLSPRFSTEIVQEVASEEAIPEPIKQEVFTLPEKPPEKKQAEIRSEKKTKPVIKKGVIIVSLFLSFLLSFFVLPLVFIFFFGAKGITELQMTKTMFENGEIDLAVKQSGQAIGNLNSSSKILSVFIPFYGLIGLDNKAKTLSDAITFASQTGESMKGVLLSFEKISQTGSNFIRGESVDWAEMQRAIKTDFSSAYQQASLAQSSLQEAEAGFVLLKKSDFFENIKIYLQDYREKLLKGQKLAISIPEIMGEKSRKTYVVLLQNNLELRPTGGFISAFALVYLENGKLVNLEVKDVYEADALLKGQVEPPAKIKEVLGEQVWYLRDANFDPEFSYSAGKVVWLLDKEMNVRADGVVSITLNTLKGIIKILGEIELPDYNEKISEKNLFEKVFLYSESNIDNSKNKEEFLVSLTKAVFEKMKTASLKQVIGIEGLLFSNLEKKEILVYSSDSKVEAVITDLSWDGNMRNFKPQTDTYSVFSDYLFVNEANLGVNKANFWTKKKTNQEISIDDQGSVEEKLLLEFENQSPSENWPAGIYKNYLRVYLPRDAEIGSVSITNPENVEVWNQFDPQSVEIFEEHEKTVVGLLFEIPIKSVRKLEIGYKRKEKIDFSKKINSYLLLVQRQSGSYSDDYRLTVTLPQGVVPLRVIPKAMVNENQLTVEESISKDKIFQIDIAR